MKLIRFQIKKWLKTEKEVNNIKNKSLGLRDMSVIWKFLNELSRLTLEREIEFNNEPTLDTISILKICFSENRPFSHENKCVHNWLFFNPNWYHPSFVEMKDPANGKSIRSTYLESTTLCNICLLYMCFFVLIR